MASNRIVICDKCGREIEVRSGFAHMTLSNHQKICKWYNCTMHDHNNITLATGSGITEMQLMWFIMGVMAIHHTWMWWKMRSKKCTCKK
jgi:uncharacterized protein YodC (DUF2158 family)